ncbi:hypothetical protein DFJ77DRAFT_27350 [Powellomyces hirtus]|nr:hypothetical protein DFJ77DRAFT_27350 [Powellomyces hirtus]
MPFPKKHVPLIKFLGPRKFLQHPHAPPTASHSSPSSSTSASHLASQLSAPQQPQRVGNAITYASPAQLPKRYQRRMLTEAEIVAIQAGGADAVITGV